MDSNITLRLARPEDAPALVEIYSHYVLDTAVTYEYEVPSCEEFAGRISSVLKKYPYLLAERSGEVLGYAYAGTFIPRTAADWNAEVSIYIRSSCRGIGLGRKLYDTLECILKEQGIVNIAAAIAAPSAAEDEYLTLHSIDFHTHMGFSFVGRFRQNGCKFGRWYDLVWMEKHIGEHTAHMPPPTTIGELRELIAEKYGIR